MKERLDILIVGMTLILIIAMGVFTWTIHLHISEL